MTHHVTPSSLPHHIRMCLAVIFVGLTIAELRGIEITTRQFEIVGAWTEGWSDHEQDELHINSGVFHRVTTVEPVLVGEVLSAPFGWGRAGATVDSFSVHLFSDSAPWHLDKEEQTGSPDPTQIDIHATAITRFMSSGPTLRIQFSGFADFNYAMDEQDLSLVLRDVTTSMTLLELTASSDWAPWRESGFDDVHFLEIDNAHEHELILSGWITSWDAKYAHLNGQVTLTAVPEPATMLLLGVGLGLVVLLRRKG